MLVASPDGAWADAAPLIGQTAVYLVGGILTGVAFGAVRLALGPMPQQVMSATQWAHAGTALALWMLLPLALGTWRITRREIAA